MTVSHTTSDRRKRFDLIEVLKIVGIIVASISGTTVVNSSAEPNERTAVIEVKLEALEADFPRIIENQTHMQKTLDSLVIMMRKDMDR